MAIGAAAVLVVVANGVLGRRYAEHPQHDSFSWGWHPIMPLVAVAALIFYFKKPLPFWHVLRMAAFRR